MNTQKNFVLVRGGTLHNGTSNVTVNSFYLDKYQLTQADYQAVMGTNPSFFGGNPNHPVERVSWFNAIEYCNRRSLQEGLTPCYSYGTFGTSPDNWPSGWDTSSGNHVNVSCDFSADGYRLPTEAEWEYAARGSTNDPDYLYSGSDDLNAVGWYSGNNSPFGTKPVGSKAPNALGLYDMSGNLWEWCWDMCRESARVVRGGSWDVNALACTVSVRIYDDATYGDGNIGFRLCRSSPGDSAWGYPDTQPKTAPSIVMPKNFVFVEGGTIRTNLTVDDFYMDKYQLTNAEWNAVMGSGGGNIYPKAHVNWLNVIEYCNRRSLQEGLTPCYSYSTYGTNPADWPSGWNTSSANVVNVSCNFSADGYRLPRESEWEYAARGGLQTHGYTYSGSNDINAVAWYWHNSSDGAKAVGTKLPNELGLYDMSGNVREWCWDMYSESDPVVRGGSWVSYADHCTVSYRTYSYATYSYSNIGFRVCRSSP